MCLMAVFGKKRTEDILEVMPKWLVTYKVVCVSECEDPPVYEPFYSKSQSISPGAGFLGESSTLYKAGFHSYVKPEDIYNYFLRKYFLSCDSSVLDAYLYNEGIFWTDQLRWKEKRRIASIVCLVRKDWITAIGKNQVQDKNICLVSRKIIMPKWPEVVCRPLLYLRSKAKQLKQPEQVIESVMSSEMSDISVQ